MSCDGYLWQALEVWTFDLLHLQAYGTYVCLGFAGKLRHRRHPGEGSQRSGAGASWETWSKVMSQRTHNDDRVKVATQTPTRDSISWEHQKATLYSIDGAGS
jgi:hypothetical protein